MIFVVFHECRKLFYRCRILLHECGIHSTIHIHIAILSSVFIKCLLWKPVMFWWSKVVKYMELCKDATAQASHLKAGIKSMFAHVFFAFLEQFGFWVDVILATSWNGIEILILKHMWKVKSDFLSRNKTKIEKVPFF